MRRALLATFLSSVACFSAAAGALAQDENGDDPTAPTVRPPAPELTPQDRARRARVVARVGEASITVGDVEDAINQQSPFLRVRYRDPEQLRTFVDGMIRFELLARAAERAGLATDPEVQRVVKQNAVQQLIRRDFDERITPDSIPAQDVQAYYDANPGEFSRQELRRASHIQVASREEAERLVPRVTEADARAFRDLAREHSLDPETRLRGGDLRYFDRQGQSRNGQDPAVDDGLAGAAFALAEVGDVAAAPVQVGERWSIVKLTGLRPAEHRGIEDAGPNIRLRLWRERRQAELDGLVTRLRESGGVQVHYDRLSPIRLDAPEREDGDEHGSEEGPAPAPATPLRAPEAPEAPEPSAPNP